MRLFDRDGRGADEIVGAVGLISNGITFDKWEPLIPFGIRKVEAIVGRDVVDALARFYESGEIPTEEFPQACTVPLAYLQQAVAFFTWLYVIPTLDAQHDDAGRSRRLGENEKGLTALQEWKDEQNILRLAYGAAEALVESLDMGDFPFWTSSKAYTRRAGLLIRSKEEFDEYYHIGSHRLFVTLLPVIREVQGSSVAPTLGPDFTKALLEDPYSGAAARLREPACRALALLTMAKAVERLPVEVIPEGVVQINISQPVSGRLRAEKDARNAVAASLNADGRRYLEQLQAIVDELSGTPEDSSGNTVAGPMVHSRGMSF